MQYVDEKIKEVSQFLPNIRPLTEFLHLNIFPGLQKYEFWQALENASRAYSLIPLPAYKFYQERWKSGAIDPNILDLALREAVDEKNDLESLKNLLFRSPLRIHLPEKTYRPLHKHLGQLLNYSLNELAEPLLMRFLGGFYDQGIAYWRLPNTDSSLLECFLQLNKASVPLYPLTRSFLKRMQHLSSGEIIDVILSEMFDDEDLKNLYIEECILSLKGWTGFIANLSGFPELVQERRNASLKDFLAIRLMIEKSWIEKLLPDFKKIKRSIFQDSDLVKVSPIPAEQWLGYRIWHESYEKSLHHRVLLDMMREFREEKKHEYKIQAFFCMDDRECSLRRLLEESREIETFGTPGHFGLDFYFKENKSAYPKKHCPAPVHAKFLIQSNRGVRGREKGMFFWHESKGKGLIYDLISISLNGLVSGLVLFVKVFFKKKPLQSQATEAHFSDFEVIAKNSHKSSGLALGYTHEEAADRLHAVLQSTGGSRHFSPLIFIIGHESTTTNNPYFNAYGCGACSGRSGHINAVAFCKLANDPQVRDALAWKFQIVIPKETFFVPGVHDTAIDDVVFFETEKIPAALLELYQKFTDSVGVALGKNAKIRSKLFELVDQNLSDAEVLKETHNRAHSIFEPRPELGHTGNAFCIVGKRSSTRGYSFERRAFLQSYDWEIDPSGTSLNAILSAVVPVCGGISLDYFFARSSNQAIGAGSKLSHNIIGLSALSNGTDDDLLPGLAYQMVELHEPIRILFVIEQELHVVESVIKNNSSIEEWIENGWVRFSCICPKTSTVYMFEKNGFVKFEGGTNV
jgi:hypothetical protein